MSDEDVKASSVQTTRPLLFVENVGQFDPRIRFATIGGGTNLRLTDDAFWLTVLSSERSSRRERLGGVSRPGADATLAPAWVAHLRMSFVGANTKIQPEPFAPVSSVASYFRGADPTSWHVKVPLWGGVTYRELYPGLALDVHTDNKANPELRLRPVPDGKGEDVRLRIEGAEYVSTNVKSETDEKVSFFDGLHILTALGRIFVSLVSSDGALSKTPRVEQIDLQTFDVICSLKR